jgi:hypothetical protein
MSPPRTHRAGDSIEDFCRVCKTDRLHAVVVVDADGRPIRVSCGYCRSDHNYRGGGRVHGAAEPPPRAVSAGTRRTPPDRAPLPIVSDRERTASPMASPASTMTNDVTSATDLELLLRRIIREEAGLTSVVPAEKWRGGTLVLRPGTAGLQEKSMPIDTFFHKVVMLRNRLRTLEQHVNASDLADDVKVKLQSYISGCYGSLTSFNVLFADEGDQFKGSGGD